MPNTLLGPPEARPLRVTSFGLAPALPAPAWRRTGLHGPVPLPRPAPWPLRSRDRDAPAHLPRSRARPLSCRRAASGSRSPRVRCAHARSSRLPARRPTARTELEPPSRSGDSPQPSQASIGRPAPPRRPRLSRPANGRGQGHVARRDTAGGAGQGWAPASEPHVLCRRPAPAGRVVAGLKIESGKGAELFKTVYLCL